MQPTSTKEVQDKARRGGKGNLMGIVQEMKRLIT